MEAFLTMAALGLAIMFIASGAKSLDRRDPSGPSDRDYHEWGCSLMKDSVSGCDCHAIIYPENSGMRKDENGEWVLKEWARARRTEHGYENTAECTERRRQQRLRTAQMETRMAEIEAKRRHRWLGWMFRLWYGSGKPKWIY